MKKIIFIIGSLRRKSFNRALSEIAKEIIGERAEVSFLDYSDLPFFSQDIEFPAPEIVNRIRKEILDSDGIWIFSPEYNFNIPGGLKNLLDWLSRPLEKGDTERITALTEKKVTFSGAGGRMATANVRKRLSEFAVFMKMEHMDAEETGISISAEDFSSDTLHISDTDMERLEKQAELFLKFIGV